MEGEKERQMQREEKESNEAEDGRRSEDEAESDRSQLWPDDRDHLGLPIMHWEALSQRIAELEKQEEEKKAKGGACLDSGGRRRSRDTWEDGSDACNSHVLALTARLQTQSNLQLCFINDSESEEEEERGGRGGQGGGSCGQQSSSSWRGAAQPPDPPQPPARPKAPRSRGFRDALRSLRDRLRADHKAVPAAGRDPLVQRRLDPPALQRSSPEELRGLCSSLSQAIQNLSAELVSRLHVRDQLRTEQDAMLLEVQDLSYPPAS